MSNRRKHTVKLKGTDAALIMREDGEVVLALPDFEEGEEVPPHIVILMALAEHLNDPEFCQEMLEYMKDAPEDCTCPKCMRAIHGLPN